MRLTDYHSSAFTPTKSKSKGLQLETVGALFSLGKRLVRVQRGTTAYVDIQGKAGEQWGEQVGVNGSFSHLFPRFIGENHVDRCPMP